MKWKKENEWLENWVDHVVERKTRGEKSCWRLFIDTIPYHTLTYV